jgi:hypothetical protein
MDNINPIFILQPVIVIAFSVALMVYWHKKRHFHANIWLYTLIAYGAAIALKYAIQIPTANYVASFQNPYLYGTYVGLQTVFLEVGLAYIIANYAFKKGKIDSRDAEAYGSGLAFWENVGFMSVLGLINLVAYYFILSGTGPIADLTYNQLITGAPSLFATNSEALGLVTMGTVERLSSAMIHIAWGYLCIMAVVYRNKKLLLIALPMGLVDFLVPFASGSLVLFEVAVFALAVLSVFVAWFATKKVAKQIESQRPPPTNPAVS